MTVLFVAIICLPGTIYDDFFERGNAAYTEHRLEDAIGAYEQLVASGVQSPPVYYNLGNACFHTGDAGRAVLYYERALALDPAFGPAERGLEAVATTLERPPGLPAAFRSPWRRSTSWLRIVPTLLLLVFWWLFWGILLLAMWKPTPRVRNTVLGLLVTIVLFAGLGALLSRLPEPGVVLEESPLRYGPDVRDATRLVLTAGDRVYVERTEGAWARVETADGLRGWLAREDLAAVTEPFRH